MYPLSWPGALVLGRMGVPLSMKVFVRRDPEAGVFVGTSPDLPGLVVEAESWDEMVREVSDLVPMMLEAEHWARRGSVNPRVSYTDFAACA